MRKVGIGCLVLTAVAIIALVISHVISSRAKDELVQQEVESVVKVLDDAIASSDSSAMQVDTGEDTITVPSSNETVDIEKTIRLLHILDDGYGKSQDMQEYLRFVASQDYRGIPAEVIKAKKKLIPYYQSLRRAEEDLNATERQNLWKSVSANENLVSMGSPLAEGIRAAVSGGLDVGAVSSLVLRGVVAGKSAYENSLKNDKLAKEARKALDKHQDAYLSYLEEYMKVYLTYMAKWNRLCLMRDQAYISINNGDIDGALTTLSQVLSEFSKDREASLLKAFCLVRKAQMGEAVSEKFGGLDVAKQILNAYIQDHPEKSAPALVLLGTCHMLQGDDTKANNLFDQSSVEYPRQSEELLDMYNSYNYRNHLTKSVEGHFVLTMYKSMMEGLGFFSPNFQKAIVAYDKGNLAKAKEEIFQHFFRRGNQDVYDYLIADMKYVEKYMPTLLNLIFEEHSFLDLQAYNPTLSFSDKLAIKIENRSDRRLSNVRLFLCLHLTDMYKDEYLVKKMETTVNNIEPHSVADFGKLQLDYEIYGKKKNKVSDIVSARAVIMTDSLIVWVDEDKVKRTNILDKIKKRTDQNSFEKKNFDYMGKKWTGKLFVDFVRSGSSVEMKDKDGLLSSVMKSKNIVFHFPRALDGLNPYFSFGQLNNKDAVMPVSVILNGDHIDVSFEKQSSFAGTVKPLFISSADGVFYMDVSFDENGEVKDISEMKF
jgi:hypothetical protein